MPRKYSDLARPKINPTSHCLQLLSFENLNEVRNHIQAKCSATIQDRTQGYGCAMNGYLDRVGLGQHNARIRIVLRPIVATLEVMCGASCTVTMKRTCRSDIMESLGRFSADLPPFLSSLACSLTTISFCSYIPKVMGSLVIRRSHSQFPICGLCSIRLVCPGPDGPPECISHLCQ
jgi:hypothetical protein